jgi:hypothetical protein
MGFIDGITDDLDKMSAAGGKAEDALLGKSSGSGTKPGEFENAEDLTAAPGATSEADVAVGDGGNGLALPELIEFIHFGSVYRDDAQAFASDGVADDDPAADLAGSPGAHGLMMRAALHREAILLGGFIRAQMAALVAEEKTQGSIGTLAALAGELTGAAGAFSEKPSAADFQPMMTELKTAAAKINADKATYAELHEAGIKLHEIRKAYREMLDEQFEKRTKPKAQDAGSGMLDAVPLLSSIVPPFLGEVVTVVQKISFKVFDVYAALIIDLAREMEPKIEEAARDITIASLRDGRRPVFSVWFIPPPPGEAAPDDLIEKKKLGLLEDALGGAVDKINEVDAVKDKVVDFLSRPGGYTPGSPFLDQALQMPKPDPAAEPVEAGHAGTDMSDALGLMVAKSFGKALGFALPGPIETVVAKIMTVSAEFLRAVYGKLITLQPNEFVSPDEFLAAGRTHLVHLVVEKLLGLIPGIDKVRDFAPSFQGVSVGVEGLLARGKEVIAKEIAPAIDPIMEFAMRDLFDMIFSVRGTARTNKAQTMEVTLALAPVLTARLFRNLFFPVWDLLLEKGLAEATKALGFDNQDALNKIHDAKQQVDMVSDKMKQASALLGGTSMDASKGADNLKPFQDLVAEPDKTDAATIPDPLADAFPLDDRKPKPTVEEVTDDILKEVEPNNKWKPETPPDQAAPAGDKPTGDAAAAGGAS